MSGVLQNTCRIFYFVDGAARKGSNDVRIGNRWTKFKCSLKKQLQLREVPLVSDLDEVSDHRWAKFKCSLKKQLQLREVPLVSDLDEVSDLQGSVSQGAD